MVTPEPSNGTTTEGHKEPPHDSNTHGHDVDDDVRNLPKTLRGFIYGTYRAAGERHPLG